MAGGGRADRSRARLWLARRQRLRCPALWGVPRPRRMRRGERTIGRYRRPRPRGRRERGGCPGALTRRRDRGTGRHAIWRIRGRRRIFAVALRGSSRQRRQPRSRVAGTRCVSALPVISPATGDVQPQLIAIDDLRATIRGRDHYLGDVSGSPQRERNPGAVVRRLPAAALSPLGCDKPPL